MIDVKNEINWGLLATDAKTAKIPEFALFETRTVIF